MKDLLKQSISTLQNNVTIKAVVLSAYIDGSLSRKQQRSVERKLALSIKSRKELAIIVDVVSSNKYQVKPASNPWFKNLFKKTPAIAFVFTLTLMIGFWWQTQNQLNYLGLSDRQYKLLPSSVQVTVNNIVNQQMPDKLFNNVTNSDTIYRSNIKTKISAQYPLYSRVSQLEKLQWQAETGIRFTVLLIDSNDDLVEIIKHSEIRNNGKNYWAKVNTTNLCNKCQYAWRVMNNDSALATQFIPFEYAPISANVTANIPDGIAKLSYYWQHGYLHEAYLQLNHISNNTENQLIKSNIKTRLLAQMRK